MAGTNELAFDISRAMKRVLAVATVLAVLAPMAPLLASLCSSMPCCAGGEDRVSAPMDCCEPAICAAPSTAHQPKAVDAPASPSVADLPQVEDEVIAVVQHAPHLRTAAPSTSLRIRLALIATLLI